MTDHKKLAYKLEDTFILGKSLPVVAMRQLPKLADQFRTLPDHSSYQPGTSAAIAGLIEDFADENKRYMDDERELKQIFERTCKANRFGHHLLSLFEVH